MSKFIILARLTLTLIDMFGIRSTSTPISSATPVAVSDRPVVPGTDQLTSIIQDIQLIESLYKDDRVMESYTLLKNIEMFSVTLSADMHNTVTRAIGSSPIITEVRSAGDQMSELLQLMGPNSESWNIWNYGIGSRQDITVSTHKNEAKGTYYFKIVGDVHCSMLQVIAALIQNNVYPDWMPLCMSSECIKVVSPHRRIITSKFDLTLLKKRATYAVHGDVIPEGGVLMTLTSMTDNSANENNENVGNNNVDDLTIDVNATKTEDSYAPMDISGGILLRTVQRKTDPFNLSGVGSPAVSSPGATNTSSQSDSTKTDTYASLVERVSKGCGSINKHQLPGFYGSSYSEGTNESKGDGGSPKDAPAKGDIVNVCIVLKVDPHMGFVPDWIFNMAIRSSLATFIPMLQHAAKQFDEEENGSYCQYIDQHTELYHEIETRLSEYKCN